MQGLPGFRDFLPTDCAARNYIFAKWREVARRYGFVEWEGPVLEPTELYRKKSGSEIVDQLFHFTDKGEREVALRPELTPTLARVVAAHEREFRKPLKWFSIGPFFRYEKQQRGRLREHFQLNCDIIGESAIEADVELVALAIDLLRALGFTADDFVVRLSDREAWVAFLNGWLLQPIEIPNFLGVIDKLDRVGEEETKRRVEKFGIPWHDIKVMLENPLSGVKDVSTRLELMFKQLAARGLEEFIKLDCSLVRGLAYYTSTVFEVFDRGGKLRAIAGGGRYDNLIENLSDGAVKMPALGFAMGDVVLSELIKNTPAANLQMHNEFQWNLWIDIYVVVANEEFRPNALAIVQALRNRYCWPIRRNYNVSYSLTAEKVAKQFKSAEALGARVSILIGDEWPDVKVKILHTQKEISVPNQQLLDHLQTLMQAAVTKDQFIAAL